MQSILSSLPLLDPGSLIAPLLLLIEVRPFRVPLPQEQHVMRKLAMLFIVGGMVFNLFNVVLSFVFLQRLEFRQGWQLNEAPEMGQ